MTWNQGQTGSSTEPTGQAAGDMMGPWPNIFLRDTVTAATIVNPRSITFDSRGKITGATAGVERNAGWSPTLAVVNDADRNVLQISGWRNADGTLTLPTVLQALVGQYLSATGPTPNIAEGTNVRGAPGAQGAGGSA